MAALFKPIRLNLMERNSDCIMDNAYAKGKKLFWGDYFQYTPTGVSLAKKAGQYITDGSKVQRGDLAFFYYSSLGRVGHVLAAYVVSVNQTKQTIYIKSIEGNTSGVAYERNGGMVAIKEYTIKFSEIGGKNKFNGFARPMYGNDTCTIDEFIEILEGEVGYIEKASNSQLDSKTSNSGDNNYTKYGKWYGCNGVAWCAQFVSWCGYAACKKHMEQTRTGWERQTDGTWKYLLNGEYIRDSWKEIATAAGKQWFAFVGDGTMVTGWFGNAEDGWYYMNPADGAMLSSQWFDINGKWYYATKSGLTAQNTYVKSTTSGVYCWLNTDGIWEEKWDITTPDLLKYELAE